MRNPEPSPILLTPDQHFGEIIRQPMSHRERLRQIDEHSLDIIYDDHIRLVAHTMQEPMQELPRRPIDAVSTIIWLGGLALSLSAWAAVIVVGFAILRP